jgi:hypothetical protein
MSARPCHAPIGTAELLDYWLGDCTAAREAEIEEHLFACSGCGAALQALVGLGDAVRALIRDGGTAAVIPPRFADRLQETGLRVREYGVEPGGSVNCTIAPHDDLVIARLQAPLAAVTRLDVLIHDVGSSRSIRLEDVGFDESRQVVVMLPKARELRQLGVTTQRFELVSVGDTGDRCLGVYVFNHTPYRA